MPTFWNEKTATTTNQQAEKEAEVDHRAITEGAPIAIRNAARLDDRAKIEKLEDLAKTEKVEDLVKIGKLEDVAKTEKVEDLAKIEKLEDRAKTEREVEAKTEVLKVNPTEEVEVAKELAETRKIVLVNTEEDRGPSREDGPVLETSIIRTGWILFTVFLNIFNDYIRKLNFRCLHILKRTLLNNCHQKRRFLKPTLIFGSQT